jgi:hypothetical protein
MATKLHVVKFMMQILNSQSEYVLKINGVLSLVIHMRI